MYYSEETNKKLYIFNDLNKFKRKKKLGITWSNSTASGISLESLLATPILLSGEADGASVGVLMISAPNAFSVFTFSSDIFSGNTIMHLYPDVSFFIRSR